MRAFDQEVALELGHGVDDVHSHFSGGAGEIKGSDAGGGRIVSQAIFPMPFHDFEHCVLVDAEITGDPSV